MQYIEKSLGSNHDGDLKVKQKLKKGLDFTDMGVIEKHGISSVKLRILLTMLIWRTTNTKVPPFLLVKERYYMTQTHY